MKKPKQSSWELIILAALVVYSTAAASATILVTLAWAVVMLYAATGLTRNNKYRIWQCIFASPFMEMWGKMSRAPLLPIELGKYFLCFLIFLLFIDWLKEKSRRPVYHTGLFLIMALLPSYVHALISLPFDYEDWVFNALGPTAIALLLLFTALERWNEDMLMRCLRFAVFSFIPMLMCVTFLGRSLDKIDFTKGAIGFAPNQVSTVLGAGMFLLTVTLALKRPVFKPRVLNYAIIVYALFRCLLTFSRGGVIVAMIAIIIVLLPAILKNKRNMAGALLGLAAISVIGAGIFYYANKISGDYLAQRYKGETKSTLSGQKEKTLNTISSGRFDIASSDIRIFAEYPVFGVGPGQAIYLREKYGAFKALAHVEFSRLLSEHGIGGAITIFILVGFIFLYVGKVRTKLGKAISASMFIFAILTTFHAAMRTNAPIVFYVMAAIPVYYGRRKQMRQPEPDDAMEHSLAPA